VLITDIISKHEKSLKDHYKKKGEPKLGCTLIHDLKQKIDYVIQPTEDWNTVYLKKLSEEVKEHGLAVKV
jgi:hypothetical protein